MPFIYGLMKNNKYHFAFFKEINCSATAFASSSKPKCSKAFPLTFNISSFKGSATKSSFNNMRQESYSNLFNLMTAQLNFADE